MMGLYDFETVTYTEGEALLGSRCVQRMLLRVREVAGFHQAQSGSGRSRSQPLNFRLLVVHLKASY